MQFPEYRIALRQPLVEESVPVKESLLQPLVLFVSFFIISVLLGIGSVAAYAAAGDPIGFDVLVKHPGPLVSLLESLVPVAVLGAVFATLYRVIHKPGNGILSFLLVFCFSLLLLTGALAGMERLRRAIPPTGDRPRFAVEEGVLLLLTGREMLVGKVEGNDLRSILVLDEGAAPEPSIFPEGYLNPATGDLHIFGYEAVPSLAGAREYRNGPFLPPESLGGLFRDIRFLSEDLRQRFDRSFRGYLVGAGSLLLLAASCWVSARLTRWPLFNAAVLFLSFRGVLFLYYVIFGLVLPGLDGLVPAGPFRLYAPAVPFGMLSLMLLVVDLLFVPSETKRLESIDEL